MLQRDFPDIMNWITVSWLMLASATATLGLIELRIGLSRPLSVARLLFSLSAFAMAAFCAMELSFMQARSLAEAAALLRWMDGLLGAIIALLTGFIWVYFGTGRTWLALAPSILFAVGISADWFPGSYMTYLSITGQRTVQTFGGASFSVLEGVPNPWNMFAYVGALALIVFVIDASVRLARLGGRRRAWIVGGSIVCFTLAAGVHSALVESRFVSSPYLFSWAFLAILVAMVSELNADVLNAARVSGELRESEQRMELASAAANLGFWTWDIGRDTLWVTSKARSLLRISDTEELSMEKMTLAIHEDDRKMRRRALDNVLANGGEYEVEFRVPLADGEMRWIASRGRVELDVHGQPLIMRGVLLDISPRHRIELELLDLRGQLAHAARVSMMGQLASSLAHELSQPLGAILRNTEAAELFLKHDPPDLEELRAILLDIQRDDKRAGDVIEGLRALLKHRTFVPQALEVSDVLGKVAVLTRIECLARKAQLEVIAGIGLPAVMGDPVQLQQVLLNLVLNATDAIHDLPSDRRKVAVQAVRCGGKEVEFAVSDLGPGIDSVRMKRLFEPFNTTKPNGLGMGLSISRTIIEAHRGRIWAENNPGYGATFRFTLPLAEEATVS
jgi:two-component system, LuxR family, sensor kinase FixL